MAMTLKAASADTAGRDVGDHDTQAVRPTGAGTLQLQALLGKGLPDPPIVAQMLAANPAEQSTMLAWLHGSVGNAYVQSVIQLNPTAPPPAPKNRVPMASEEDLKAQADRITAEDLLKSKDIGSGENARKALEIMLEVDEDHRGRVIDNLDDKAFQNLLERVPDDQRERFARLVEASKRADRKLLLWAEFHKSRAENDLNRRKGDIGRDAPLRKMTDEEGDEVWAQDAVEQEDAQRTWTRAQRLTRKRHERRTSAVDITKGEVDTEVKRLMAKAKTGTLTLADVDGMRERKDLEYQIELENNISLTADAAPRDNGEAVVWSKPELDAVRLTLARLPQVRDPDAFDTLNRSKPGPNWMDGKGGETVAGDHINIFDWGAISGPGFRHGGDKREMVSDEFKKEHGELVGTEEFVLTHEVGHDVAPRNKKAFDAFTKAAGWQRVKSDTLRADGVSATDIAKLETQRKDPAASGGSGVAGNTKSYSPISGGEEFWAAPKTGIPTASESAPGDKGVDTWQYARVDPGEHFAEVYAKAVHVPEKLHDELVERPTNALREARAQVAALQSEIDDLQANQNAQGGQAKLEKMKKRLAALKEDAASKATAQKDRGEEFRIMREDVFHTDKAVVIALDHLKTKNVSAAKLKVFEERAAVASTPEQIAYLENEAMK